MPTNVSPFYLKAEKEYHEAETTQQRLKALKKMLSTVPKHKGTEKLQKEIKEKIRKVKYKQEKEAKQKKKTGYSSTIKREGAAQVAIIGLPNSGKSTLLKLLSNRPVEISEYEYTTREPVIRMIPFENIKFQGIELPAVYEGFADSKNGRQLISIMRNCELIIVVGDKRKVVIELEKADLKFGVPKRREGFTDYVPYINIRRSEFNKKEIAAKIWKKLDLIRVQTRSRRKIAPKPIILRTNSNVKDVVKKVHKDFIRKFRYAKIWGPSAKFKGQQVGFEHKLKDNDIVEVFLK